MQSHIIKKIHKHTDVNVLKTILNLIKQEKTKHRNVDINFIDELIKNFIIDMKTLNFNLLKELYNDFRI